MPLLEGRRIYMKLIEREDLPIRVEWINDPRVGETLNFDYPTSLSRTEKWFEGVTLDKNRLDFTVFRRETDERIGACGFLDIDRLVMKAELYVLLGEKTLWGSGYGTEMYSLIVEYGFVELGLERIFGYQLKENAAAHRIVEKLGWKREGLLRRDLFSHGRPVDRYVVSILKEDWLNIEKG